MGPAAVTYSDIELGFPGIGNIEVDPLFRDPASTAGLRPPPGDLRLRNGSLCIDMGTDIGAPAADIADVPRPQGGAVDIGAFEHQLLPDEVDSDGDGLPDVDEEDQGCNPFIPDAALYATIDYPCDGASFSALPIMIGGQISSLNVDMIGISTDGGVRYDKAGTISGLTWS